MKLCEAFEKHRCHTKFQRKFKIVPKIEQIAACFNFRHPLHGYVNDEKVEGLLSPRVILVSTATTHVKLYNVFAKTETINIYWKSSSFKTRGPDELYG